MTSNNCIICGTPFTSPRTRKWCSAVCKKEIKSIYDKDRYSNPEIRRRVISNVQKRSINLKEDKRIYDKKRRETRPEYFINLRKNYKYNPPKEHWQKAASKRRARQRNNGVYSVTTNDLIRLRNKTIFCPYCHTKICTNTVVEFDHVIPISRGGAHSIGNLLAVCFMCNRSKGNKYLTEWKNNRVYSAKIGR